MSRPLRRAARSLAMVAVLTAWLSTAFGQPPRPQAKWGTWNVSNQASVSHFGILGEVAQPGAYRLGQGTLSLQELVQQAGGFTNRAATTVRVIRGHRAGAAMFINYNSAGRDPLSPNDLVIVDTIQRQPFDGGLVAPSNSDSDVWLGLMGVLDRPVIVRMRGSEAQASTIIAALQQSPALGRSFGISVPPRHAMPVGPNATLPNGTVLFFDPTLLVRTTLPTFPEPYEIEARLEAGAPSPSPFLNALPPTPTTTEMVPDQRLPTANASRSGSSVEATTLPYTATPHAAAPANPASMPAPGSWLNRTPSATPRDETRPAPTRTAPVAADAEIMPNLEDAGDTTATAPTSGRATFSFWEMFGIVGTVASLVGVALLSRRMAGPAAPDAKSFIPPAIARRSALPDPIAARMAATIPDPSAFAPPANSDAPPPMPAMPIAMLREPHDLAEILKRRDPIETEPAILPRGVKLAAPRATEPQFRLDAAAPIPAPHMTIAATPAVVAPVVATPVERQAMIDDTPARIPAPHFARAKRERTPAAPPVPAPTAEIVGGTAIERALQRLQGMRS